MPVEVAPAERLLGEALFGLGRLEDSQARLERAVRHLGGAVPVPSLSRSAVTVAGQVVRQGLHRLAPSVFIGRARTPFSVFSRTLDYHSISLGMSRVVNPSLVVGVYADTVIERGDQSKPYRYVPVFAPDVAAAIPRGASPTLVADTRMQARPIEQLPLARERLGLTGRLAWRGTSTTLRFEERLYADTWGQRASTTDARYFIDVGRRLTVWPHGRFNLQNGVDFWKRAYSATSANDLPALRTGDRELGPLFTLGGGGGARIALGPDSALEDLVLTTTVDGFWTSFADAIYVKERFSMLVTTALEITF